MKNLMVESGVQMVDVQRIPLAGHPPVTGSGVRCQGTRLPMVGSRQSAIGNLKSSMLRLWRSDLVISYDLETGRNRVFFRERTARRSVPTNNQ